jgi:hypothetical protein
MKKPSLLPLVFFTLCSLLLSSQPVVAAPGDWWADYFATPDLSGAPALSRYDTAINFDWGLGSPASSVPADNFSVRWTRDEWFTGGTYRFTIASDDGVRVWVGDQLVVDEWRDHEPAPITVDRYIAAGTYRVRVEYYEHGGGALISVGWSRVVGGTTWRGEYFDNTTLSGTPRLVRNDSAIDFDWGAGSPDPSLPADNFSIRWTRALDFNAGTYRFLTSTDDGVRVWVDGKLVVDSWIDQSLSNTHTGDVYLANGQHTIVVEYYEHGVTAGAHVWWQLVGNYTAWHGEYFDNPDLSGGPALERDDAEINFDWSVAPPVNWMPDDNFSVRWTRSANFTPGYYRFAILADDGARVWIDQGILIDQWHDEDYQLHYVDGTYLQGTHTIRVEYYEHTGSARVRFWWEPGTSDNTPPGAVSPTPAGVTDDPWQAVYFANTSLSGDPVLTRIETALDHNWGLGSPGEGVPRDNFSARWTQPLYFDAGVYRFTTYTDDGVRLWVDGRLLIDSWRPMRGTRSASVRLSEGTHEVKMEYYERTGTALARLTWQRTSR